LTCYCGFSRVALRVSDACVLIGLQRRQTFRLLRGLKQDGAASLLSKRRGKPSNHQLPAEVRTLALSIVRERHSDFGSHYAAFDSAPGQWQSYAMPPFHHEAPNRPCHH
jgi:hypothetical protein